jgi:hypothetical protein
VTDDPRLARFGVFTPEGVLTPGYGDHYLFLVGRDDVHGIIDDLLVRESLGLKFNMFGYDDQKLNDDIMALMKNPNVAVQGTLDKREAAGPTEKAILASDLANNPDFYNSFVVTESADDQISHTKGGVLVAQMLSFESSVNWSASGEGAGISLDPLKQPAPGYKAQNNTFVVSANPVFFTRFSARLDVEHKVGLQRRAATARLSSRGVTASCR